MRTLLFTSLAFVAATAASAQSSAVMHPGYIDFDPSTVFGQDASAVEITLEGPLLTMMSNAVAETEPELSDLLGKLKLIRVHVAPLLDGVSDSTVEKVQDVVQGLEGEGWERVMRMRETDGAESLDAFMKVKGEKIEGFTMFVLGDDQENEGVFINIVGEIDPAQLGKLAARFLGDEMDVSVFEQIAKQSGAELSPLDQARNDLAEAKRSADALSPDIANAAERLAEEAEQLADDGHTDSAVRLLKSAASLYRTANE